MNIHENTPAAGHDASCSGLDERGAQEASALGLPHWSARFTSRQDARAFNGSLAHLFAAASADGAIEPSRAPVLSSMAQAFLSLASAGVGGWARDPAAENAAQSLLQGLPDWARRAALGEALAAAIRRSDAQSANWLLSAGAPKSPEHGSCAQRALAALGGDGAKIHTILEFKFREHASLHSWPALAMASGKPSEPLLAALASHGALDGEFFCELVAGCERQIGSALEWRDDALKHIQELQDAGDNNDQGHFIGRQLDYVDHVSSLWEEALDAALELHPWSLFPDSEGRHRWEPADPALRASILGRRLLLGLDEKKPAARAEAAALVISRGWTGPGCHGSRAARAIAEILCSEADFLNSANMDVESAMAAKARPAEASTSALALVLLPAWPSAASDVAAALALMAQGCAWERPRPEALLALGRWLPSARSLGAAIDSSGLRSFAMARLAAGCNNAALIGHLADAGAIFSASESAEVLFVSASKGYFGCVSSGLKAGMGAGVNMRDASGFSPLEAASLAGSLDCVELLLAAGADWRPALANSPTALDHAARKGHAECAAALLRRGALARQEPNPAIEPALAIACLRGDAPCARMLLDGKAPVDEIFVGFTALGHASRAGSLECVQLLLSRGARPELADSKGSSLAELATQSGKASAAASIAAACLAESERSALLLASPAAPAARKIGRI